LTVGGGAVRFPIEAGGALKDIIDGIVVATDPALRPNEVAAGAAGLRDSLRRAGLSEAADGTRTHDLLHGKQCVKARF
jgi:glycine/serine hydroxymethyltransferase